MYFLISHIFSFLRWANDVGIRMFLIADPTQEVYILCINNRVFYTRPKGTCNWFEFHQFWFEHKILFACLTPDFIIIVPLLLKTSNLPCYSKSKPLLRAHLFCFYCILGYNFGSWNSAYSDISSSDSFYVYEGWTVIYARWLCSGNK